MRIVFSRKGFDSSYGGAPSPIIEGRPCSLPIPGAHGESTTYGDIGSGPLVEAVTRGRLDAQSPCHDDPMFANGMGWLGQAGAAQGHLRNQHVADGDVFLFFGLFAEPETQERHHRIFAHMRIACHGPPEEVSAHPSWAEPPRRHPHFTGDWGSANTIYHGPGRAAEHACAELRLTQPGGPLNAWIVPAWLKRCGLSYHTRPERWTGATHLDTAKRGQEFVCDIGDDAQPRAWLEATIGLIES